MALGKKYTPAKIDGIPKKFNMIVFGSPKVGKTSLGASAEDSLLIECEDGGAKSVACNLEECNSLDRIREIFMEFIEGLNNDE